MKDIYALTQPVACGELLPQSFAVGCKFATNFCRENQRAFHKFLGRKNGFLLVLAANLSDKGTFVENNRPPDGKDSL